MHVAVAALLKSPTVEQASQVVGIPVATLRRWRNRPEFAEQLAFAQGEILQGAINNLRSAGVDASATLSAIARDSDAPAAARVRASLAILNLLLRAHKDEITELRITRIENQLKARKNKHG
jgi:thiamine monophosphate synthase